MSAQVVVYAKVELVLRDGNNDRVLDVLGGSHIVQLDQVALMKMPRVAAARLLLHKLFEDLQFKASDRIADLE